jgi:hypothetical protein
MKYFAEFCTMTYFNTTKSSRLISRPGKAGSYKQPLNLSSVFKTYVWFVNLHSFFCVGVMYSGEYDACDVTLSVYTQSNITSIIFT